LQTFLKYQPLGLRVWHWFNAAVVTGLLTTVVLRKTLFSVRANTAMIEAKGQEAGVKIDPELAKNMANQFADNLWNWHVKLGYALAFCLFVRLVVAFIQKDHPVGAAFRSFKHYRTCPPTEKHESLHYALVRLGYLLFYVAVTWMVASGLSMVFNDSLKISQATMDTVGEWHENTQYFFFAFVIVHVAGVVLGELGRYGGIISNMIHGGSRD